MGLIRSVVEGRLMTSEIISPVSIESIATQPKLIRRIQWLIQEAKADDKDCDLAVTYIMRTLSNYFTVGKGSASSSYVKLHNRIMSRKALELLQDCDKEFWNKETINDHPEPLKEVWKWLMSDQQLSVQRVAERFYRHPLVTITKDEDRLLSQIGLRARGLAIHRYENAGIEIVMAPKCPRDHFTEGKRT